jgi:hypothetical protein
MRMKKKTKEKVVLTRRKMEEHIPVTIGKIFEMHL